MEFISLTHACTFRFNSQLNELRLYVPPDTKQVISETFFPANLLVKFWIPSSATTEGLHDASVAVLIIMGWGWTPALRLDPSAETLDPNTETLRRSNALQRQCSSAAQPYKAGPQCWGWTPALRPYVGTMRYSGSAQVLHSHTKLDPSAGAGPQHWDLT